MAVYLAHIYFKITINELPIVCRIVEKTKLANDANIYGRKDVRNFFLFGEFFKID